jgi:hypothetical protein
LWSLVPALLISMSVVINFLKFWPVTLVGIFLHLTLATVSVSILGFTWLSFGIILFVLGASSTLAGRLAYLIGGRQVLHEPDQATWRQRLSSLAIIYVCAIVLAVYLSGQQSPRVPSVEYETRNADEKKAAILLSYSADYWSFIDCEGDLLVISAHEIERAQITGKSGICGASPGTSSLNTVQEKSTRSAHSPGPIGHAPTDGQRPPRGIIRLLCKPDHEAPSICT